MISHKHKYIFIHIPKCGGTSCESYLLKNEGVIRPTHLQKLSREYQRKYFLDHKKNQPHCFHSEVDIKLREKYFSFTFVRNPFDRVVSEYKWNPKFNRLSFLEFLKTDAPYGFSTENPCSKQPTWWQDRHEHAQIDFIDNHINFIGRFENLQEDFDIICDKIGIPHQKLPHKNKSKHKHYTEYYDDETREIVTKKYKKDIDYFNYKFEEKA